jgi:hypothetical protein
MKRSILFLLLILLLFGATLVWAGHGGLPNSGWTSGQQIQNVGSAGTSIKLIVTIQV